MDVEDLIESPTMTRDLAIKLSGLTMQPTRERSWEATWVATERDKREQALCNAALEVNGAEDMTDEEWERMCRLAG